mmetsp:Transcript_102509/g.295098  ORF Transcript_102509/g.295098 Transcript_102509/m.295098 type:complete len:684 (+) Transcript_102509:107-2158(+)
MATAGSRRMLLVLFGSLEVVAAAEVATVASAEIPVAGGEEMTLDDECAAGEHDPKSCALGAFQLRASRAAREAQLEAAHRDVQQLGALPDLPPMFGDDDDEDDDDEDDEEHDEVKPGNKAKKAEKPADGKVAPWDQCGGDGWMGATQCTEGHKCVNTEKYYAMCIPDDQVAHFEEEAKKKIMEKQKQDMEKRREEAEAAGFKQAPLKKQDPLPQAPSIYGTDPIVIKGNFMYNSRTGDRFFAKGVAYNPRNIVFDPKLMKHGNCTPGTPVEEKLDYADDPTVDELESMWKPALNAIADLGANTVRLYNIDPQASHDKFMNFAASLGLYVIIPLTRKDWGWLPAGSPSPHCYSDDIEEYGNVGTNLLVSAKLIVKQFSQYNNTLLFTVANEMTVADKNGYAAFPCVKALTRDIHRYQQECREGMRRVPLIYADMDMGPPNRELVGRYLACELESAEDVVDAYGLNVYSWCDNEYPDKTGKDNFEVSPYYPIAQEFENFAIPLIFTEFGCTIGEMETECPYKGGRTWVDVRTFFSEFKEIMSGAVAFEFSMEDNQYGLALSPGFTSDPNNDGKFYYLDNYFALQKQFRKYNVATLWNGAEIDNCKWTPDKAHKLQRHHKRPNCPKKQEVAALFKQMGLNVAPNWDSLPPIPANTSVDELEFCPEYTVSPTLAKEACCHFDCGDAA